MARNREDLVVRNKELRFQVYSLETLMGLTHQLNSSLEMEELLNTLILSVVGQLRVNSACLFLTDQREHPSQLNASTFKGLKEEQARGITFDYNGPFREGAPPDRRRGGPPAPARRHRRRSGARNPPWGPSSRPASRSSSPVLMKARVSGILAVGEKVSGQEFQSADIEMLKALSESAGIAIENARLFKDLQEAYVSTVRLLVSRIEEKDPYTHGHTERVAQYSVAIAKELGFRRRKSSGSSSAHSSTTSERSTPRARCSSSRARSPRRSG